MARIIFSVMGDALGHISQALAVAREMPRHEFLFLGGGKIAKVRDEGYSFETIPMPGTYYRNNKVDVLATAGIAASVLLRWPRIRNRIERIIKDFDPHLVLTSYEFFTPLVARKLGIKRVSIDNQHVLTKCVNPAPRTQTLSRLMFSLPLRVMFSNADMYFVNCFAPLAPINGRDTRVFPPLLSPDIQRVTPTDGEHVLVYQTSPTFHRLIPCLEKIPSQCVIYGFGEKTGSGNLVYRAPSKERFLEELAGCRYAITNGGHTVISEALYFGKPVFAFPIHLAYEQFFNGYMLSELGYGRYSLSASPDVSLIREFERSLDACRARIVGREFYGNVKLAAGLEELLERS